MAADFDPGTGLGPRLREVRVTHELSVRELARRVGCSASLISQIERGVSVPSVGVLYSLATELGSSLDYLLFGSGAGPGAGAGAGLGRARVPGGVLAPGGVRAEGCSGRPRRLGLGRSRRRSRSCSGGTAARSSTWPAACAGSDSRPARTP